MVSVITLVPKLPDSFGWGIRFCSWRLMMGKFRSVWMNFRFMKSINW